MNHLLLARALFSLFWRPPSLLFKGCAQRQLCLTYDTIWDRHVIVASPADSNHCVLFICLSSDSHILQKYHQP